MLVVLGEVLAPLTVMLTVRRLWPVRRSVPRLLLAGLVLDLAALLLWITLRRDNAAIDAAWACLAATTACLLGHGVRSRPRQGRPWFRWTRLPGSYVLIWTDAVAAGASVAAIAHATGGSSGAIATSTTSPLIVAVLTSVKLWRHNHRGRVSSAGPPRLPESSALPQYPVPRS